MFPFPVSEIATFLSLELRESFRLFDKDGDGKITAEEIAKVLASININIAENDVKLMIREVDSDGTSWN